jgi:hypothetical protein
VCEPALDAQQILEQLQGLPALEFAALQANLRPHAAAVSGFMAADESLLDIVARDVRDLAQIGLTPQRVGARLQQFLWPHWGPNYRRSEVLRAAAAIPEYFDIVFGSFYRGYQGCPFSGVGGSGICPSVGDRASARQAESVAFAGGDFTIHNKRTGEKIKGPGLLTHLAIYHNFFEGRVRYRVDPVALARILELV